MDIKATDALQQPRDVLGTHLSQYFSTVVLSNIDDTCVLYENIDQILPNKLHGPMHYRIGVTCVFNGHVFYTLLY